MTRKQSVSAAIALLILCAIAFASVEFVLPQCADASNAVQPAERVRIGTFDAQSLVVAYYRSNMHEEHLRAMQKEQDKAVAGGDEKKAAEIGKQGEALQELAHNQLTGEARIDNILESLKDALPAVAEAAKVDLIVEKPAYASKRVEQVDVTDAILAKIMVDQKTLDMIKKMREERKQR